MSTKFTKHLTINAPGEDFVFDGIDFTEDATVEITAANSVTFKNCRFYNIKLGSTATDTLIGNIAQSVKAAGYKLVIQNCFFGKTDTYNMVNAGQLLFDGSGFVNNYLTNDCARDDRFSCYMVQEGATLNFNGNQFENYTHNSFQFSFFLLYFGNCPCWCTDIMPQEVYNLCRKTKQHNRNLRMIPIKTSTSAK